MKDGNTKIIPTPAEIALARHAAGLTQDQAAELVFLGAGTRWGEYERGARLMDYSRWELFAIKTGQHPDYKPAKGTFVPTAKEKPQS